MAVFSVAAAIALGASACGSKPAETSGANDVRSYADPATENLLLAINENSVERYERDGNAEFKAAVTQEIMDTLVPQVKAQFGDYVSKEFLSTEEAQGYIIVHYKARFTKGELGVRMVFDKDRKVAGQFFE
jgi:hypothetical protein